MLAKFDTIPYFNPHSLSWTKLSFLGKKKLWENSWKIPIPSSSKKELPYLTSPLHNQNFKLLVPLKNMKHFRSKKLPNRNWDFYALILNGNWIRYSRCYLRLIWKVLNQFWSHGIGEPKQNREKSLQNSGLSLPLRNAWKV